MSARASAIGLSGVLFAVEVFVGEEYRWLFLFNPMYCFVTLARASLLGSDAGWATWLSALLWSVALLGGGFVYFRAAEHRYGQG